MQTGERYATALHARMKSRLGSASSGPEPEARRKLAGGVSHRIAHRTRCAPAGAREPKAMPSTHLSLHYHIIFSTKDRVPFIADAWRERLHAYLGGVVRNVEGISEAIGGVADHVHLLIGLRATACLADVVRDVKAVSSPMGSRGNRHARLCMAGGIRRVYRERDTVRDYIARQEEHHRTRTFQEEYLALLRRSGVAYDERYLW